MKVNKFNTRNASNIPRTLHLRDPFNQQAANQVIVDENGKTLDFQVYGARSDISRNALKATERKYGKKHLTDEQAVRSGAEYLAAITAGWSDNVEDDDGPIPYSYENAVNLYIKEDWIAEQVGLFSRDITNYDPTRSGELKHGSDNSPGFTRSQKTKTEKEKQPQKAGEDS